jgi:hypothetical protein
MKVRKNIVSQWDMANEVLSHRQFCRAELRAPDGPVTSRGPSASPVCSWYEKICVLCGVSL